MSFWTPLNSTETASSCGWLRTCPSITIDRWGAGIDDAERLRIALEAFHPGWQRVAYRYTDARQNAQPFVFEFEATDSVSAINRPEPTTIAGSTMATPQGKTGR